MIELLFWLLVVLGVYITVVSLTVRLTMNRWEARSGLVGVGLVNIVVGFLLDRLVTMHSCGYPDNGSEGIFYVANYAFLIMGISGIVMVAVDLLRSLQDLRNYVSRINEKKSSADAQKTAEMRAPASQGNIPTWKRIELEQNNQTEE